MMVFEVQYFAKFTSVFIDFIDGKACISYFISISLKLNVILNNCTCFQGPRLMAFLTSGGSKLAETVARHFHLVSRCLETVTCCSFKLSQSTYLLRDFQYIFSMKDNLSFQVHFPDACLFWRTFDAKQLQPITSQDRGHMTWRNQSKGKKSKDSFSFFMADFFQ